MTTDSDDLMNYRLTEQGIHHFQLHSDSREAVDVFIRRLEAVYREVADTDHVPLLIDMADLDAGPPLRYIARQMKPFFDEFPDRPKSSLAILTRRGSVLTMISNFLSLFSRSHDRYRFFNAEERDDVIPWLLDVQA